MKAVWIIWALAVLVNVAAVAWNVYWLGHGTTYGAITLTGILVNGALVAWLAVRRPNFELQRAHE